MVKILLEAVTKKFDEVTALDRVSLEIADGEMFFLLGPSGCGKTTLLRLIAGFCRPDAGAVFFDGARVDDLPPHRRQAAMVFQNYALWPHMTVAGNIAFGLTVPGRNPPRDERNRRVQAIMEAMQLGALAGRRPAQLSGGQQQRVALARALVVEPDCLLLDEPLSNLDAKLRQEMRVEIRRLIKQSGMTAVYVTHDQQEALSMADRCAILQEGRIAQIGRPEELYEHPRSPFVADFVGGANLIPGMIAGQTSGGILQVTADGRPLAVWHGRPAARDMLFTPGQAATVCARPERIRLLPPAPHAGGGRANLFRATVKETLYFGNAVEYWLALSAGGSLRADAPADAEPFSAGAAVDISVEPEDVMILPGAPGLPPPA